MVCTVNFDSSAFEIQFSLSRIVELPDDVNQCNNIGIFKQFNLGINKEYIYLIKTHPIGASIDKPGINQRRQNKLEVSQFYSIQSINNYFYLYNSNSFTRNEILFDRQFHWSPLDLLVLSFPDRPILWVNRLAVRGGSSRGLHPIGESYTGL